MGWTTQSGKNSDFKRKKNYFYSLKNKLRFFPLEIVFHFEFVGKQEVGSFLEVDMRSVLSYDGHFHSWKSGFVGFIFFSSTVWFSFLP